MSIHAPRSPGKAAPIGVRSQAAGWAEHAEALADWTLSRLAVRRDVHGRYGPDGKQITSRDLLTRELLIRHFRGEVTIGVHSTGTEGRCLAVAWDIDAHDDQADPEANRRCAFRAAEMLANLELKALVFDSNGKGGYHVRVFFRGPIPVEVAYWLCERIKAALKAEGLACGEAFPKQGSLSIDRPYGNWIRVPGKHHKRDHWSRIFDPGAGRWFEGEAAARRLLAVKGDDPDELLKAYQAEQAATAPEKPATNGRGRLYQDGGRKADEATVREALGYLPDAWADDYGGERGNTAWLGVGMALNDWDQAVGLDLWKEFSQRSAKYDPAVCEEKWRSFTPGCGLTVATIFAKAKENGWRRPGRPRATAKPIPSANGNGRRVDEGPAAPATDGDGRVDIRLTADFHLAVDAAAAALAAHPDIYERGDTPVQVVPKSEDDPVDAKGVKRAAGAPQIIALNPVAAKTLVSRLARFWAYDRRERLWIQRQPPRDVAEAVINLRPFGGRELVGVVEAPTLRPDGSLLVTPGYDRRTGLLYLPNAPYPRIVENPTLEQVEKAAADLLYLVADFPFREPSDKAAWLALVLTLVARGAIEGAVPGWIFTANVAGSGKSILVAAAARISAGRAPAFDGYADDDAEMEKRLGAVAMLGDPLLLLDNAANGSAVGGPAMDRAIKTEGTYRTRVLGKSEMTFSVAWRTVIAVTGNNLSTKDDALRRFVPCFLLSPIERPETRDPAEFSVTKDTGLTLDAYIDRERPRLVAAALTILRGYIAAGRPRAKLTAMDFEAWENLIRQAVYHAIRVDPCGSREKLEANDETTRERHQVVSGWQRLCIALDASGGATAREGADALNDGANVERLREIRDAFPRVKDRSGAVDALKLGHLLRRHRDAVTPFGRLQEAGKDRNKVVIWTVE